MNDLVNWQDKPVKYLRDQVVDQLKYNLVDCWLRASKVILPPGLNVITKLSNIMGSVTVDNENQGRIDPNSQTIVLEGKVVMGEV